MNQYNEMEYDRLGYGSSKQFSMSTVKLETV